MVRNRTFRSAMLVIVAMSDSTAWLLAAFFSLNAFLQRVGEEEGVEIGAAEAHARAVVGVLKEAVSGGEMQDVRWQFPSEFDPLFGG